MSFSSHPEKRKLDKTETLVTIGDMTNVSEETETDFYNSMSLYFQFDSVCIFSGLFELVSLLSKRFHAFKAYILLLHVFSLRVTLTRVRVTH